MRWFVLSCVVVSFVATASIAGIRFNLTPSMPRGLYVERLVPPELHRGDIVEACAPTSNAAVGYYIDTGICQNTRLKPLLKEVVAVAGDTVAVTEAGISVNGVLTPHSARLPVDGQGRLLSDLFPVPAEGEVPSGFVWLVAPNDKSFDSRYLGWFPVASIIGVMDPLLTE